MNYQPITAKQAREFIRLNISNPRIPAGLKWFMVFDCEHYPANRRNVYLIASGRGLTGVVGVGRAA